MLSIIRAAAVLSFIFVVLVFTSCGVSTAEQHFAGRLTKPLATPQTVSNRPKIVAFGDSLTAGFGLTEKESYPYLLAAKNKSRRFTIRSLNAGVPAILLSADLNDVTGFWNRTTCRFLILELGAKRPFGGECRSLK
jgi:acyl-CoA thioesterase-1